jgi:NAD+ kinase
MAERKLNLKDNKNIALVYRLQTAEAVTMAKKISAWLKDKGYAVFTAPQQTLIPGTKAITTKAGLDKVGLVIALGGDGTYLRAVRTLEGRQVPIIGINMGSLGFLTGNRAEDAFKVIEETLENKMDLRPRSMIHVIVRRKNKTRAEFHALNDVVIERGSGSQLISTAIYSEKFLVSEVKADGFIIASPTGSTAYNLAAGGPDSSSRSESLRGDAGGASQFDKSSADFAKTICKCPLKWTAGRSQHAQLIVDGQNETEITVDDEVIIQRSSFDHLVVRAPKHNYFHLLREKLKFGDRA